MAKGLEKYQERQRRLSLFGKDLTRRSRSCCELCGKSGQKLAIFELPPVPVDPEIDRCLFLCSVCSDRIENPKSIVGDYWRFLSETIWSDIPTVQILAARILDCIGRKEQWAIDVLDDAYLDEEITEKMREQVL